MFPIIDALIEAVARHLHLTTFAGRDAWNSVIEDVREDYRARARSLLLVIHNLQEELQDRFILESDAVERIDALTLRIQALTQEVDVADSSM